MHLNLALVEYHVHNLSFLNKSFIKQQMFKDFVSFCGYSCAINHDTEIELQRKW